MESWKKTFAVIWSGQLASILSSEVVAYSIIFWMSLETGSAEDVYKRQVAALCTYHCNTCVAPDVRAVLI